MKIIMGKDYYEVADYFDDCRAKRNITDYSYAGKISASEAEELIREAGKFLKAVRNWLKNNYSQFLE